MEVTSMRYFSLSLPALSFVLLAMSLTAQAKSLPTEELRKLDPALMEEISMLLDESQWTAKKGSETKLVVYSRDGFASRAADSLIAKYAAEGKLTPRDRLVISGVVGYVVEA